MIQLEAPELPKNWKYITVLLYYLYHCAKVQTLLPENFKNRIDFCNCLLEIVAKMNILLLKRFMGRRDE